MSRFSPAPPPNPNSRFHNLAARLADATSFSPSSEAVHEPIKRPEPPRATSASPKKAAAPAPAPAPAPAVKIAPPMPTRAQIDAAKRRLEQEAEAARAAAAKVRREAADAVWAKAYGANNTTNHPSPSVQTVKPVYSAAQISAAGMSAERMAAADAVWDRAANEAAKLRGHLQ